MLNEAVAACRAALEVYTQGFLPQYLAMAPKSHLAITLRDQASACKGDERRRLHREAMLAMRARATVYQNELNPDVFRAWQRWIESSKKRI